MDGGIFLLQPDESLVRMDEQDYEAEELLQKLLADYPALLAGDQIDAQSPRRWLFIGREIGVPSEEGGASWWSLDHLFLDQDAIPTLVEVKRSSNTEIRRQVVAQMLDYAANASSYWPVSRMRELYGQNCETRGVDPEADFHDIFEEEIDAEEFWSIADQNLRSGRIRLLFVSDRIPPQLRRIVEFLNQQMNPAEVLALEVKQFIGAGDRNSLKTLVPRVIGQSEAAREKKQKSPATGVMPSVSVEQFSSLIEENYRSAVERLLEKCMEEGFEAKPHSTAKYNHVHVLMPEGKHEVFSFGSDGFFRIYLGQYHDSLMDNEIKTDIQDLLRNAIPEKRNDIANNFKRDTYIGFRFDQVAKDKAAEALEQVIEIIFKAFKEVPIEANHMSEDSIE